jgi:hypothetical protein
VQRPLTSGTRGWLADQTPWPVGPTLQPLVGWLYGETLQEAVTANLKPKVGGGWTPWSSGHVARPTGHHFVSYQLDCGLLVDLDYRGCFRPLCELINGDI